MFMTSNEIPSNFTLSSQLKWNCKLECPIYSLSNWSEVSLNVSLSPSYFSIQKAPPAHYLGLLKSHDSTSFCVPNNLLNKKWHKDFKHFIRKKYVLQECKEPNPSIVIDHSEFNLSLHFILFFVFMFIYLNFIFRKINQVIYL